MLHINLKHHLARLTLSVLLAAINTCSVFASGGTIRGHGTEYDPYIIADAIDWEVLVHYISIGHTSYIGHKFYKLADNYNNSTPVSTMLGDDNKPFLGVFDGNFKVVSMNIVDNTTAEGTAPFRKIHGATIKNFIVQGSVSGQGKYTAGLVGKCSGSNTIENCQVSTQVKGKGRAGGIVGYGGDNQLTLSNSFFAGTFSGDIDYTAGLVGWCGALELTINNCLFKGSFTSDCHLYHPVILSENGSLTTAHVTDTYYLYASASNVPKSNKALVPDADGVPVSETLVEGTWDIPVTAADGRTYFAQTPGGEVTIGNLATAQKDNGLPMDMLDKYSYSQQIYTAEEIGTAGSIKSITLWLSGFKNIDEASFDIYMVETDKDFFESTDDWVPVTSGNIVYSGSVAVQNTEPIAYTFMLNTLFNYSGNNNLLICFNKSSSNFNIGFGGMAFYTDKDCSLLATNDYTAYDPTNPTSFTGTITMGTWKNVLALDIEPSGSAVVPRPDTPTVSNVTTNEATLSWTGGTGKYNLEYKKANDGNWTRVLTNTTKKSHTLTDLTESTEYRARVQSVDAMSGALSGWRPVSFSTDFEGDRCLITIDVEGFGKYGIKVTDALNDVVLGTVTTENGSYVTETISVPNGRTIQFQTINSNWGSYTIYDVNEEVIASGMVINTPVYYTVDCSYSPWRTPTNLTALDYGPNSIVLDWTEKGESNKWVIAYWADGEEELAHQITTTNKPFTLTGLTPETAYNIQVRPFEAIKWSDPLNVSTDISFAEPKKLAVSDITPNSAVVSWNALDATSFDLEYIEVPQAAPRTARDANSNGDGWYYYDNGTYAQALGRGGSPFYWGVMFPAGSYHGSTLSAVSIYAVEEMTGIIIIYNDNDIDPDNVIGSKPLTLTDTQGFVEVSFDDLPIDDNKDLWVVVYNESGAAHPAAYSTEAINTYYGRLISFNGTDWHDTYEYGYYSPWMIRAKTNFNDQLAWITPSNVSSPQTLTGLRPDTRYWVRVKAKYSGGESKWKTTSFTTFEANPVPFDLAAIPTANSATLSWKGFGTTFDIRYRESYSSFYNFDDSSFCGWTTIDADGDGHTWNLASAPAPYFDKPMGSYGSDYVISGSYAEIYFTPLTPDNYLVSPKVELGGSISFTAYGWYKEYLAEHFGVAVSTTGNTNPTDFTTIQEWDEVAEKATTYTVDLSAYSGEGYVAIRHFDCYDQYVFAVDDIVITNPSGEKEWITLKGIQKSPYRLVGLSPSTLYQYQIQSVKGNDRSDWTDIAMFTTLESGDVPTGIVNVNRNEGDNNWYSIDGKKLNGRPKTKGVYIRNGRKIVIK